LGLFSRTFDEIVKACVPQACPRNSKNIYMNLEVEEQEKPSVGEVYDFKATF